MTLLKKIGYKHGVETYPTKNEIELFDFSSRCRKLLLNEILIWINNSHNILVTKIINIDKGNNLIKFNYKIY